MNNPILDLLNTLLSSQSKQSMHQQAENPAAANYPPEAYTKQAQQTTNNLSSAPLLNLISGLIGKENNSLSAITSLLGNNNPLASIMSGNQKKKEEAKQTSSKDELLL